MPVPLKPHIQHRLHTSAFTRTLGYVLLLHDISKMYHHCNINMCNKHMAELELQSLLFNVPSAHALCDKIFGKSDGASLALMAATHGDASGRSL